MVVRESIFIMPEKKNVYCTSTSSLHVLLIQREQDRPQFEDRRALEAATLVRRIDHSLNARSLRRRPAPSLAAIGFTISPVKVSPAWLVLTLMR